VIVLPQREGDDVPLASSSHMAETTEDVDGGNSAESAANLGGMP
jgi:hypothetical protein